MLNRSLLLIVHCSLSSVADRANHWLDLNGISHTQQNYLLANFCEIKTSFKIGSTHILAVSIISTKIVRNYECVYVLSGLQDLGLDLSSDKFLNSFQTWIDAVKTSSSLSWLTSRSMIADLKETKDTNKIFFHQSVRSSDASLHE